MVEAERATRPAPAPPAWTWTDAANATWDVYEAVAGGAGGSGGGGAAAGT
jgi:hypothetical protein